MRLREFTDIDGNPILIDIDCIHVVAEWKYSNEIKTGLFNTKTISRQCRKIIITVESSGHILLSNTMEEIKKILEN